MEPPPRTRTCTSGCRACPPSEVSCTPARRPVRASAAEFTGMSLICWALTDDTEPVTSRALHGLVANHHHVVQLLACPWQRHVDGRLLSPTATSWDTKPM